MQVKVLKTEQDHAAALARLDALMDKDPVAGSSAEAELDLLALVIEDYERKRVPAPVVDPIQAIEFRLDQQQLSRKDLIPFIGSASKVSEVMARKRPLSLSMIRRLHQGLGIPAEVLIADLGSDLLASDEEDLDFARFPLTELLNRGCLGEARRSTRELKDYAEELIRPLLQALLPQRSAATALMRAPLHQRGRRTADPYALLAWRLCVLKRAREKALPKRYEPGSLSAEELRDIARLSSFGDGPRLAGERLAQLGIALVVEPHFTKTYLDGAAMLDQGRPVVALTLRHDRLDNFWFTLLHELAHVALHLSEDRPLFVDDLEAVTSERLEAEADAMAQHALIPSDAWAKAAVPQSLTADDAQALAEQLRIHPAIVVGRLRRETGNYKLLSGLTARAHKPSVCWPPE
ncbi:ImmA/IrrE family metallo-endopeptidase [Inhella sp.]|uniref:ImmA/IrrE family metallo-endopeptidase n=1 Tax=Inhella sp. TaxID=1921806 RepID=UPI0035B4598D